MRTFFSSIFGLFLSPAGVMVLGSLDSSMLAGWLHTAAFEFIISGMVLIAITGTAISAWQFFLKRRY